MSLSELMIEIPAEYEANVFGQFDVYVKKLERTFHVTLISRDGATKIVGERAAAEKVQFMIVNMLISALALARYTERNGASYSVETTELNGLEQFLDTHYPDARMERIYPNAKMVN